MKKEEIKILLIEDDPFLLSMYSTKFELEGFRIITAEDGEKGLRLALTVDPSIILLDILLPKMNGFDVLEKLKADDKGKDIPVILLTNLNQKDEIERAMSMGADDYLIKAHFLPSEVVEKIMKILDKN
ncbi:response regulator [bacterium]|nr:response regulator [bacterium]